MCRIMCMDSTYVFNSPRILLSIFKVIYLNVEFWAVKYALETWNDRAKGNSETCFSTLHTEILAKREKKKSNAHHVVFCISND